MQAIDSQSMEALTVGLLGVVALLLALLLWRGSRRDDGDATPLDTGGSGRTELSPASYEGTEPVTTDEPPSYRVVDPTAPDRELLVEFVPSSLAELSEESEATSLSDTIAGRNAVDALVDSLPKAAALIESGMTMRVVGPPQALEGLGSGVYTLVSSGGRDLGQVREVATGQFGSRLEVAGGVTPAMGALAVFQVMSVVTGQYYLHRIDSKLGSIQATVDRLVRGQQSELQGQIEGAAELNERVRERLLDGIPPDQQDLNNAEHSVLASYGEAKGRLADLLSELRGVDVGETSKSELRAWWERLSTEGVRDAQLLIFAAFVRHQNNLLSLAAEPQGDVRTAENIRRRTERDRERMIDDLRSLRPIYKRLQLSKSALDQKFVFGVDSLAKEAYAFRRKMNEIREVVENPGERVLPEPPPIELPFLAEISAGSDGQRRTVAAVLSRTSQE